jgi:hypothetical protein
MTNEVPAHGLIKIVFPPESDHLIFLTGTVAGSPAYAYDMTTKTVTVTGACPCAAGSTKALTLQSTFIKNMGWIKLPLTSTDSF